MLKLLQLQKPKTYKNKGNQVAIDVGHSIVNGEKKDKRVISFLKINQ